MIMKREDICDLTTLFGGIATAFQAFFVVELFQASEGSMSGVKPQGPNIMLSLIQAVVLLIFYASLTGMAFILRKET